MKCRQFCPQMHSTLPLVPDGLYAPEIAEHSLEKIKRHNYYAALFACSMAGKWQHRVYIGLYAGAGRAVIKGSGHLVETSAVAVIRQDCPFTKYIFVDDDPRCISALGERIAAISSRRDVELIESSVNSAIDRVEAAMPKFGSGHGEGLLALCFVDPFRVDLDFAVIRRLSRFKIDFLVMLPFGYDLRRNLRRYLDDNADDRVAALIDHRNWRRAWRAQGKADRHFVRFALENFNLAMERLGFRQRDIDDTVSVKVTGMGVYLYSLALYTRHELGEQFWRTTIAGTAPPQLSLGL
jgi:three-Cys-motif partner protein